MRLRDLTKMQKANDGTRTLFESALAPELIDALQDWQHNANPNGVLIGGMGLSYYVKPRMTQDLDFLFLTNSDIPTQVNGFKRTRPHAFQHNKTHVEVEVITPELVKMSPVIFRKVIETANESNGVHIASPAGLIALKIFRLKLQDEADIVALIKSNKVSEKDLLGFSLPADRLNEFRRLEERAAGELD